LVGFHTNGNPFRCVADESCGSSSGSSGQLEAAEDDAKDVTNNQVSYLTEMLSTLLSDDNGGSAPSKRSMERNAAMVVTQTSLHGLAKFSGQYLQLMQLMPSAACEVFDGLCHLFEYYLCTVFIGFVSAEDRLHLFSAKTRSTAPPPQQAQEFEVRVVLANAVIGTVITHAVSHCSHVVSCRVVSFFIC
jgi:hypothetical protein